MNIVAGTKDRVSRIYGFRVGCFSALSREYLKLGGGVELANITLPLQIQRSDHSSASSAEAPSYDETFCSDTIGLCTRKMEEYLCTAKSSDELAQSRLPWLVLRSQASRSMLRPWNKSKPAATGWSILRQRPC